VVVFDAFGCGRSPKPRAWAAYATEALLEDACALFAASAAAGGDGRALVVGHSFGTALALRLAAREAARDTAGVDSAAGGAGGAAGGAGGGRRLALVLVGAAAHLPDGGHPVFRLPLCLLRCLQPALSRGFAARAFHAETRAGRTAAHRALLARATAASGANPMHMVKAFYRQFRWISRTCVYRVACPVLIVQGEGDGLTKPAGAVALRALLRAAGRARCPACEVRLVPRAAHQVMEEQPLAVNDLLDEWVAAHLAAAEPVVKGGKVLEKKGKSRRRTS
jgi:pimeloyl-ACP methyl ester carboxylesterase